MEKRVSAKIRPKRFIGSGVMAEDCRNGVAGDCLISRCFDRFFFFSNAADKECQPRARLRETLGGTKTRGGNSLFWAWRAVTSNISCVENKSKSKMAPVVQSLGRAATHPTAVVFCAALIRTLFGRSHH